MLYWEIIVLALEIHTKPLKTHSGPNVELFNVKLVVYIVASGLQSVESQLYKPVS
jgi:hypothetical protein